VRGIEIGIEDERKVEVEIGSEERGVGVGRVEEIREGSSALY